MKTIDLAKLKERSVFKIRESSNYYITPSKLSMVSLKKECLFEFESSNITTNIIYKCVAQKETSLDLTIILRAGEKSIKNIDVNMEIYILNLSDKNTIKVRPILEIPQKEISFEHKVTIGAPNERWIKYLRSRGLTYKQGLKLISDAFITG